jgi:hypothetical protein
MKHGKRLWVGKGTMRLAILHRRFRGGVCYRKRSIGYYNCHNIGIIWA